MVKKRRRKKQNETESERTALAIKNVFSLIGLIDEVAIISELVIWPIQELLRMMSLAFSGFGRIRTRD